MDTAGQIFAQDNQRYHKCTWKSQEQSLLWNEVAEKAWMFKIQ